MKIPAVGLPLLIQAALANGSGISLTPLSELRKSKLDMHLGLSSRARIMVSGWIQCLLLPTAPYPPTNSDQVSYRRRSVNKKSPTDEQETVRLVNL